MKIKHLTYRNLILLFFFLAIAFFLFSHAGGTPDSDARRIADRTERKIEARVRVLDQYLEKARETDAYGLMDLNDIPDDMVIYKYVNDSLQSWCNQFSIINDDISARLVFQRLTDQKSTIVSPLSEVSEDLSYMNLGPKWYIVKSVDIQNGVRIIAGIEILNTLIEGQHRTENGVNPILNLPRRYSIVPLSISNGSEVSIQGKPLFKIVYDADYSSPTFDNSLLKWISLLFLAVASVLFLAAHRTMKVYLMVLLVLLGLLVTSMYWGYKMEDFSSVFSPTLYADGPVFFSLGALLLLNAFITLVNLCTYLVRRRIDMHIRKNEKTYKRNIIICGLITLLSAVATFVYTHISVRSLILNSSITLELYRWNTGIPYTVAVYVSYAGVFISILFLFQMMRPFVRLCTGRTYNIFSRKPLVVFAFLWALYMTLTSSLLGFRKEQDRVLLWANRLAVERDISLEIQLRSIEDEITSDQLIATLTGMENAESMILNRVSEYYMSRIRQAYDIDVLIAGDEDRKSLAYFNNVVGNGTPIADSSSFFFLTDGNGNSSYAGLFLFYNKTLGLKRMLIMIEPNSNMEDRGYHDVLGRPSKPGSISIPPIYSYARYSGGKLVSFKGNYPYPTISSQIGDEFERVPDSKILREKGNVHFMHLVDEHEMIVISRPVRTLMVFFTSFSYLMLALTLLLLLFVRGRRSSNFRSNYFRTRINTILFVSSCLILVSMTIISVLFVYKRNEVNMYNLMSSKINTVQALVEDHVRHVYNWRELRNKEFFLEIEKLGNTTKSDISIYTPEGKVFHSTMPEVFEKMVLGSRMPEEAFYNIRYQHQRFYISREIVAGRTLWSLYAPIFNDSGDLIAIIAVPYTDKSFDFRREALFHAAMIINFFLLLLIGSLLFSTREVNSMFSPLLEMGRKMKSADINNLEYIVYKREDEISSLVDAYNRMVRDLSDSTRQLAQAERDNAWSQMARQVAHEIKNPLTPIKLELQRLIRLKQKGNPAWEEKFDKVSAVVLEHIDILTDTANEFSTFAKLYSEEPVLLDLDRILKDQLLIFDNKENIRISYLGMADAYVVAPKPQLIRVFVNLITNAIQAVEMHQREVEAEGGEPFAGKVTIYLRNSIKDGFYDVVVDDNGTGVKEENVGKLFTPNFTTKSAGTGLGLAICRNIMEKCGGEISYKRSYSLGGASFTVTIPKKNDEEC